MILGSTLPWTDLLQSLQHCTDHAMGYHATDHPTIKQVRGRAFPCLPLPFCQRLMPLLVVLQDELAAICTAVLGPEDGFLSGRHLGAVSTLSTCTHTGHCRRGTAPPAPSSGVTQ